MIQRQTPFKVTKKRKLKDWLYSPDLSKQARQTATYYNLINSNPQTLYFSKINNPLTWDDTPMQEMSKTDEAALFKFFNAPSEFWICRTLSKYYPTTLAASRKASSALYLKTYGLPPLRVVKIKLMEFDKLNKCPYCLNRRSKKSKCTSCLGYGYVNNDGTRIGPSKIKIGINKSKSRLHR